MRTLLLLRGVQGSGKSTFVKEKGLEPYTLSTDNIRLMLQSPIMTLDGYAISQNNNKKTFELLYSMAEDRMKRGEFIVIDATNTNEMINKWRELAKYYKYTVYVKEFKISLEEALERNNTRGYKAVPEHAIASTYEKLQCRVPSYSKTITELEEIDNYVTTDLSEYNKIVFIGDIHGCCEPLKEVFKKGIKDEVAYVFLGDYIDRGLQNKEVMEFLLNIYQKRNVFMLEGNHEGILNMYSREEIFNKPSFDKTAEELEDFDKKELKRFYKKLLQCMFIKFNEFRFLVTHGGLPFLPTKLTYIATNQLIKGVGTYDDEIDKIWYESTSDVYQIHGHRSLKDYPNSISLEDGVEFGGNLKVLEVTKEGMEIKYYKNEIFDKELQSDNKCKVITEDPIINEMTKNRYVRVKKLTHNRMSLNFTRQAFKKGVWNSQTIKARGLFVDTKTGKVVARSFEKFFNLDDNNFTTWKAIKDTLFFPVNIYRKENGFLGILSHHKGKLAFYSKSTDNSEYSSYFKEIFMSKIKGKEEELLKIIKEKDLSLVFEVVDIKNDPHIIEYKENKLYFLESFKNELFCIKGVLVDELNELFKETEIESKVLLKSIDNKEDLFEYLTKLKREYKEEGVVVEDSLGYMFKVKTDYYNQWKYFRSLKDYVNKGMNVKAKSVEGQNFLNFLHRNKAMLKKSIIDVRKDYIGKN